MRDLPCIPLLTIRPGHPSVNQRKVNFCPWLVPVSVDDPLRSPRLIRRNPEIQMHLDILLEPASRLHAQNIAPDAPQKRVNFIFLRTLPPKSPILFAAILFKEPGFRKDRDGGKALTSGVFSLHQIVTQPAPGNNINRNRMQIIQPLQMPIDRLRFISRIGKDGIGQGQFSLMPHQIHAGTLHPSA